MDLAFSPGLAEYRDRARAFIREHAPPIEKLPGTRSPAREDLPAFRTWVASLFEAGFLGADWPVAWGGDPGHTPLHDYLFDMELGAVQAPTPVGAWRLVANALFEHGTEAQRRRYLPGIRSAEDFWCQLFSEPDAGSDLAALRCRAERDGDTWVIDGQKVWTTHGHIANLGFLLARSDADAPKHRGISAFVVDMGLPGIEVRPLRELTGSSDFNEVFFDGVRLPADAIIGAPGEGWGVARDSLSRERSESRREDSVIQAVRRMAEMAQRNEERGRGTIDDGLCRQIGRLHAQAEISDLLGYAEIEREMTGSVAVDGAAITKVFFTELNLEIQRTAVDLQGSWGLATEGEPLALDSGRWLEGLLWARGFTISAGSNEVMRNIIAERGLGLPRD